MAIATLSTEFGGGIREIGQLLEAAYAAADYYDDADHNHHLGIIHTALVRLQE